MTDQSINICSHLRTKEEIDELFSEMKALGQVIDNKLDFTIRMAIQKVKLQQYYEEMLVEYRSLTKTNESIESTIIKPTKVIKNTAGKKTKKKKKQTSLEKHDEWVKGLSKEEIIAINKERVAKYHPKPDMSEISPAYRRALYKMESEKCKRKSEEEHRQWVSIVSVPFGGMNKKH